MRLLVVLLALSACAQTPPDFSGSWRYHADRGADRQLDIQQKDASLFVKTTVTSSKGTRSLDVKYEIGGPAITYKGLDGDEFRSSVRWDGTALVFETIEREDGREIPEKTVWTLDDGRNSLQVNRQSTKSGKSVESSTVYVRKP